MANQEQLDILQRGVEAWNAWRGGHKTRIDLSGAELAGANLLGANLADAKLVHANFCGANLSKAFLVTAELTHANLSQANLQEANLSHADLLSTNFSDADLSRAVVLNTNFSFVNLSGANLAHSGLVFANLSNTILNGTSFYQARISAGRFCDVDLSSALDLESIKHVGPSSISIDTIYKSKGKIPEAFLRGCGVPDALINYIPALLGAEKGMQFYSCFISYSSVDEEFARRLHSRLQQEHVRVWFAPEDIQGGKKLHEQIDEAIRVFDKLLIVLSPASLKSEWVMTELRKARKRERQTGLRKLFPLRMVDYETLRDWECFDADHGQDLATEVREYFIPDFSNWKDHDAFEIAFARLLKDLQAANLKSV